jgi:hypothetical protein
MYMISVNSRYAYLKAHGRYLLLQLFASQPNTLFDGTMRILLPFLPANPEVVLGLHDISQDRATREYNVLSQGGIFNLQLEFPQAFLFPLQKTAKHFQSAQLVCMN